MAEPTVTPTDPTPKPDAPGGSNPDKAIQNLQMKLASSDRVQADILAKLDAIAVAKPPVTAPAPDPFSNLGDDDTVDAATLKGSLAALTQKFTDTMETGLSAVQQQIRGSQSQVNNDRFWNKWEKDHSEVSSKRDEFLDGASLHVDTKYPGLGEYERATAVQIIFDNLVEGAESGLKKNVPSKNPPQSTAGVKVTPDGAKGSTPANDPAEPEIGPLWVPDTPTQV